MSVKHTIFDELIVGSPLHISRQISIASGSGILQKCWLTVKDNQTQTDTQALIKKTITTTSSGDGQITDPGGSGTGTFVFNLLPIDTGKLIGGKKYLIDIWVKTSLDDPTGIETGIMIPHYAVTLDRS